MKLKTLALAVGVLAVLSVIAWYLQRPPAPAALDPRVHQPLVAAQTLEQAAGVRLTSDGKTVLLKKVGGGNWIDSSYYDLPADFSKLGRFVDDLSGAKIERLVTRRPERLARLDFKDTTISLLDGAGKELWKLTLGKAAEGGGRFVKYDDEAKGYLANLSVFLDSDAKNWADSQLVDLKADDIGRIELGFDGGETVVATRAKKDDPWTAAKTPAGQRVSEDKISSLLSTLTTLRFENTAAPGDPDVVAARQHARLIKLTTFDHQTVSIELGRKPEEKVPETGGEKSEVKGQKSEVRGQKPAEVKPGTHSQNAKPAAPPAKPAEKTIPAGPVYAFVSSSDASAPINAMMKKRAFEVYDWNFTSLPKAPADLFEPIPPPEQKNESKPATANPPAAAPATPPETKQAEATPETKPATTTPSAPEAKPAATPGKP